MTATGYRFLELKGVAVSMGFSDSPFVLFCASMYLPWDWKDIKQLQIINYLNFNSQGSSSYNSVPTRRE